MIHRLLAVVLVTCAVARAASTDVDMIVGTDGSRLLMRHDFSLPVVVTPSGSADGFTRHTTTQPGFDAVDPLAESEPGFRPVKDGVPLRIEITAVDPGASFKLGTAVLDAPGASAPLATSPDLHVHGEWRLILPDGVVGSYTLAFRLLTTSPAYQPSPSYAFVVTNDPSAPPPTTTLPAGVDQRLAGTRLALAVRGGTPKLALVAKDRGLAIAGDPTVSGATLRLVSGGGAPFDVLVDLPPSGWRRIGRSTGWRFTGAGPIRRASLRAGKGLALVGRGVGLPFTLAAEPDVVRAVLAVGAARWCVAFGGTTTWKAAKRFTATNAPAPGACPS